MVQNIQEIKNPGGSNHFKHLVAKAISPSLMDLPNQPSYTEKTNRTLTRFITFALASG
jgi:hypothetical protein